VNHPSRRGWNLKNYGINKSRVAFESLLLIFLGYYFKKDNKIGG
jgi:hypothetical protein